MTQYKARLLHGSMIGTPTRALRIRYVPYRWIYSGKPSGEKRHKRSNRRGSENVHQELCQKAQENSRKVETRIRNNHKCKLINRKNKRETKRKKVNNKFVRKGERKWASQRKTNIWEQDKTNGQKNIRTIIIYIRVTKRARGTIRVN